MKRIMKLQEKLNEMKLDGYIFSNRNNIFYFTGYRGEGLLAVKNGEMHIVTDFRYVEQAQSESPESKVLKTGPQSASEVLNSIFSKKDQVGFEEDNLTVVQLQSFKKACTNVKFIGSSRLGMKIRAIKDENEIEIIIKAGNATQDALNEAYRIAAFGMQEIELSTEIEYYLKKKYGAGKAFDFIVASGENGSMPHAITGPRKFKEGDMVTFDFGANIDSYNSDMTRTFAMGKASTKLLDIYKIVQEAQCEAQRILKPGIACKEVDKVARDIIAKQGYSEYFGHGVGHGVGLNVHELPVLNSKSEDILQSGMVVTVEPGIYIPNLGGVRIENTCYITEDSYTSLYDVSTELNIISGGNL
ncbi:MAG: aminopeptidase P family protein [Clostridiales bacterium]|nr:aminopeptidase P family protein [Clostridiales bacterium]